MRTWRTIAGVVLASVAATACATPAGPPPASIESADKTTCDELTFPSEPGEIRLVDRILVPYSRTVLGVEAEYEDDRERTLMLISGGYLDDITEPYDDLRPAGKAPLIDGTADMLIGSFFGEQITVAYRLGSDTPCSTLAIVAVGFSTREFVDLTSELILTVHE